MNDPTKLAGRGSTLVLLIAGVFFLAGGLIFLCAAVQNPARLPIAALLLLGGGGLAAWAGLRWRKAQQLSPGVLAGRITDLALAHDAEIALAQVISALDVPDDIARATLADMETQGLCHRERRDGRTVYVFPGLKESKVVRRCSYCGSEYSVREPLHKCANCGGPLEIVKT